MADEFDILTEQDKRHVAYGLCVLGTMAVGATFGSIAGGQTLLGAAGGAAWGLFTCKFVTEPLKERLFSQNQRLSEGEFMQVLRATKQRFPLATKAQALDVIADARLEARRYPAKYQC